MVGVALAVVVLGGAILQDALYIAFRNTRAAAAVSIAHLALGRFIARILLAICLPGAMFCVAALYMRSWDESALAPLCLVIFIGGSVLGAMIGLRQSSRASRAIYKS